MTLDDVAKRKLVELLQVDDIEVASGGIGNYATVRVRIGDQVGYVKVGVNEVTGSLRTAGSIIGEKLFNLAREVRARCDLSTTVGADLERVASQFGMSRELLNDRCRGCGHPQGMHGRGQSMECTIWGCDCPCYITPGAGNVTLTKLEPDRRPMTRFEAIAEELKKL